MKGGVNKSAPPGNHIGKKTKAKKRNKKERKKMKRIKSAVSVLVIVMLIIAMSVPAYAAGPGKITVNGTVNGKIYDIYKIFDLTQAAGSGGSLSYTIDSDWVGFFTGGGEGASYLTTTPAPSLNQLTYSGTTYYINITDSNVAEFAQKALNYAATKTPDKTSTASGTTLVFDNLDLGYYLVYPQGAADITPPNGSICSLTSTTPETTVNVKATYPNITKTVDDQSVDVGQVVTYTVKGKVPDTTGYSSYKYEVKDTMSPGLTFNSSTANFSVKFGDTPITDVSPVYAANGFTLTYDMTAYQAHKGKDITITYSAVVNKNAVATLTKNKATLTYSNDPETPTNTETTPPVQKEVYTSKIVVDKRAENATGAYLSGASFILVKKTGGTESFYKYDAALDKVTWVSDKNEATVKTTDSAGAADFIGLEDGTYYLRETEAPSGYNMLASDVTVTVTHTTVNDGGQDFGIGVSLTSQIINKGGIELPGTGGIGTTIFYVLGGALTLGALVVFITRSKIKNYK